MLPITIAGGYALAALSWNLLEKPFLRLKRFFEPSPSRLQPSDSQFVLLAEPRT